jgi:sec-independent protein translocase protein TatA
MFGSDLLAPTHLLLILVVALLVLGPKRLPEVGRSLGKGLRDFRDAMTNYSPENLLSPDEPVAPPPPPAPATAQAAPPQTQAGSPQPPAAPVTPEPIPAAHTDAEVVTGEHVQHPAG